MCRIFIREKLTQIICSRHTTTIVKSCHSSYKAKEALDYGHAIQMRHFSRQCFLEKQILILVSTVNNSYLIL